MTIVADLRNALTQLDANQAQLVAQNQKLLVTKHEIVQIDPQLMDEARYDKNTCCILKILYIVYYFLKDICYHSTIKDLKNRVTHISQELAAAEQQLATSRQRLDALNREFQAQKAALQTTLSAEQRELGTTLRQINELKIDETAHWWITNKILQVFYSRRTPELNLLNQRKIDSEARIANTQRELAPFLEYEPPEPASLFQQLQISEEEKQQLQTVVSILANNNVLQIIPKLPTLFSAKAKLAILHPLKSLEELVKNPNNLLIIKKEPAKWIGREVRIWGFVPGFRAQTAEKLQKFDKQASLIPYLPGFAKSLGLNAQKEQEITTLAQNGQWEQFIEALLEQPPTGQR